MDKFIYLFIHQFVHFVHLEIAYQSIHLFIHPFIYPSFLCLCILYESIFIQKIHLIKIMFLQHVKQEFKVYLVFFHAFW